MKTKYTAKELKKLPTISSGQFDNLKIDDGRNRIWLCRCGIADGMPYNNQITHEKLIDGRWEEMEKYAG